MARMTDAAHGKGEFWDARAGVWERRADTLDRFSDSYGIPAMDRLGVGEGERVLDVGCGPGTTAVELATRVGPTGEVVGLDISPAMIAAAQRRAKSAGAANLRFVIHDLEEEPIDEGFDAAYSRFGVMFFDNPVGAFTNIGRSLRSAGRLGCAVWGPLGDNPWMFVPTLAASGVLGGELALPGPDEPGPFSLSDPERIRSILEGAGFSDIVIAPVAGARVIPAANSDEELRTLMEMGPVGEAFDAADDATRGAVISAVMAAIEPYREERGWRLAGTAFAVTAARA